MSEFKITAILNAHREGILVAPTLKSVENAISAAQSQGVSVEIMAVLDRTDDITKEIFSEWVVSRQNISVCHVDYGDLGLSRNHGVSLARGEWIAFLDADDLWSANWLTSALQSAETEARLSVWHPETNLFFGVRPHIYMHIDMDSPSFDACFLAETNIWTALCFTSHKLLTRVPYQATSHHQQIGYEDWGWNMETILHGAVHKTVAGTAHAVRTKEVSLVGQTTAARCLPHPPELFRAILAERERSCFGLSRGGHSRLAV